MSQNARFRNIRTQVRFNSLVYIFLDEGLALVEINYQSQLKQFNIYTIKRQRLITVPEENILTNFTIVMHNCIASEITPVIKAVSKKLDDLKQKSLNDKRLPIGILTDAAKASACLSSVLTKYLDDLIPIINIILWHRYAKKHFDNIAESILSKNVDITEPPPCRKSKTIGESYVLQA
ncbi:hypothetical protein BDF21DRAFT_433026 [Thamnidium elegans]|nr:hypothetical protein BDF21DRAFT_433026 [Thamnidium elegans]